MPQSGFRNKILAILRDSIARNEKMGEQFKPTERSLVYRRKASDLAAMAKAEPDELKMLPLIEQALSWVRLAENEELIANRD
jgi:hypothetical protein